MLRDLLSFHDIETIDSYRLAALGQESFSMDTYDWLESWAKAKKVLYTMLGDSFTYKIPVNIGAPEEQIEYDFNKCSGKTIIQDLMVKVLKQLDAGRYGEASYSVRELFSNPKLYINNIVNFSDFQNVTSFRVNGQLFKLKDGEKTLKAIRRLCKMAGTISDEEYNNFSQMVSTIWNTKSFKGNLVFSIHPMDYLTLSDNAHGWRSCVNVLGKGAFCDGVTEMMNSRTAVVVYFEDGKKFSWEDGSWISKRWRSLFIVDNGVVLSMKGYPYQNEPLMNIAFKELCDLCEKNLGWSFSDKKDFNYCDDCCDNIYFDDGHMYNDIGEATAHHIAWTDRVDGWQNQNGVLELDYVGDCICFDCGKPMYYTGSNSLVCDNH